MLKLPAISFGSASGAKLDIDTLWKRYKDTGDSELQGQLVEYYLPLVRSIASGVMAKLHYSPDMDDLVADGLFGLLRAMEGFDISRGYKFETYATTVVRGAIYNGLRRMDWLPERTRAKARAAQKAVDELTSISGRKPTEAELAEKLKISADEVFDLISSLGCVYVVFRATFECQ